jgi:hypothetical protein
MVGFLLKEACLYSVRQAVTEVPEDTGLLLSDGTILTRSLQILAKCPAEAAQAG